MARPIPTAPFLLPTPLAVLELLKPITWFPPMWAFMCGVVAAGQSLEGRWGLVFFGVVLAGPLVCATSQAVNDWFDRYVDAINEPHRPIPSGRIPGHWGLYIAIGWTALSLLFAAQLGVWGLIAGAAGLALAWAYSAPPLRLKSNGWYGNSAVALCYEGLAWLTGVIVASNGAIPDYRNLWLALLYSAGAHGIMTLNDFKSVRGDRHTGVGSLPVRLGIDRAAKVACAFMALAQCAVVLCLLSWNRTAHAGIVAGLLIVQLAMMVRFLRAPMERATWYSALGVVFYVLGMLVSAFAVRSIAAVPS